ncbi:hypothetical protein Ac2012v2_001227 [Leucoagaricus gongylophorus]
MVPFYKRRAQWFQKNPPKAPSSEAATGQFAKRQIHSDQAIFCGRPYSIYQAIPPTLLCPQFSQFMVDLDSCTPSTSDIEFFYQLSHEMSDIFTQEAERNNVFINIMRKHGFPDFSKTFIGKYHNDGTLEVRINQLGKSAIYLVLEVKNELGKGGAEPMVQAALYWLESIRPFAEDGNSQLHYQTNFPAVLLLHNGERCSACLLVCATLSTGPYISAAVAVYADAPNVQILNPVIPLHFHPSDYKARATGERFICALRRLLSDLKNYYTTSAFSQQSSHLQPQFPFYSVYTDGDVSYRFVYEKQIDQQTVFVAHLRDNPEDKIFVKFTRCYGEDTHRAAHARGFAPKLRAVERFQDGWIMVVMDDVSHQYCEIERRPLEKNVYKAVQQALVELHGEGFVHGDLREANIMVKRDGVDSEGLHDIILVDFDWAGKEGSVRYPSNITLNHILLPRPDDVERGGPIAAAHDNEMLKFLS